MRSQEDLLHHVLGVVRVAQDIEGDLEQQPVVLPYTGFKIPELLIAGPGYRSVSFREIGELAGLAAMVASCDMLAVLIRKDAGERSVHLFSQGFCSGILLHPVAS